MIDIDKLDDHIRHRRDVHGGSGGISLVEAADLIAEVRALRAEVAAMRPVVDGAWNSYGERGALDLRVGDVIDEDDVRLHAAHCEDIGVPLRAWRAWRQAKERAEAAG